MLTVFDTPAFSESENIPLESVVVAVVSPTTVTAAPEIAVPVLVDASVTVPLRVPVPAFDVVPPPPPAGFVTELLDLLHPEIQIPPPTTTTAARR